MITYRRFGTGVQLDFDHDTYLCMESSCTMKGKWPIAVALFSFAPISSFAQRHDSLDFYFEISQLVLTHQTTNEIHIIPYLGDVQYSILGRKRIRRGTIEAIDTASLTISGKIITFSLLEKIRIKGNTRRYRKNTKNHSYKPHVATVPGLVPFELGAMMAVQLVTEVTGSEHKKENPYYPMTEWKIRKNVTRYNFGP